MVWYNPQSWFENGAGWVGDRAEDLAEGVAQRGAGAENMLGMLSSIGNGFNVITKLASMFAAIAHYFGYEDFANSMIHKAESLAARSSLVDENAETYQTQMEDGTYKPAGPTGDDPENPLNSSALINQAEENLTLGGGMAGGYMAGRATALAIGTANSGFSGARNLAARFSRWIIPVATTPSATKSLTMADRLLGSTRWGRIATYAGIAIGATSSAFAEPAEASMPPASEISADAQQLPDSEYFTQNGPVANAPPMATEFDAARATNVGLNGVYTGLINGVSYLGYAVDGANWALDKARVPVSDNPIGGSDQIRGALTQAYNGYVNNVAPQLADQPQTPMEVAIGNVAEYGGELVGAFGVARGLQVANAATVTGTQLLGTSEGIKVAQAFTPEPQ